MDTLPQILDLFAAGLYTIAAWLCLQKGDERSLPALVAAALGVLLHGISVFQAILTPEGASLALANTVNLMLLVMTGFVTVAALRLPIAGVLATIAIISAASLTLTHFYPPINPNIAQLDALLLFHIAASLTAGSVLLLAFLQAILLLFLERSLKQHALRWVQLMPPLETMERLLFTAIWVGLAALAVAMVSGFYYMDGLFSQRGLAHHVVILSAAAFVYAGLLVGRYRLGWRGRTAVKWVIAGTLLLLLGYFGSKFVIEFLLA